MASVNTYRKKRCTKCSKSLKVHIICFKCEAAYHAKCLLKVQGVQVSKSGQAFCCQNITSKYYHVEENLKSSGEMKREKDIFDSDEDWEDCLSRWEGCEEKNYNCKTGFLGFSEDVNQKQRYVESSETEEQSTEDFNTNEEILEEEPRTKFLEDAERSYLGLNTNEEVNTRSDVNAHKLRKNKNTGEKHSCTSCEYSTYRKTDMLRHTLIHTNEKPFKCDKCEYAATQKTTLDKHRLVRHGDEKTEYSAYVKSNQTQSLRAKEKPFKCDQCEYRSRYNCDLERHRLAKHSSEEKNYKCTVCEYSAHFRHHLAQHMYVHVDGKPFKCDTCHYATNHKRCLVVHMNVKHSGGTKPFQCKVCEYSAVQKTYLMSHIALVHAKEKPFKCEKCEYAASRKYLLTRHTLTMHNDQEGDVRCATNYIDVIEPLKDSAKEIKI